MRKLILLFLLIISASVAQAQDTNVPKRLKVVADLPLTCFSGITSRDVVFKTGSGAGEYSCTATDTWALVGPSTSGGTVTSVAGTNANGVSFSISNPTTTPNITIALGAITPTTVNGNTFSTGTYTLSGVAGKTFTFNKSLTLDGTDSTTHTFPTTSSTVGRTDAPQSFTGLQTFNTGISIVSGQTLNWNSDLILRRVAAANIAHGAADVDTAPVAQTLSVQNTLAGGTSNVAGANLTIAGSQGKGTGVGGSVIIQVAPAGSTGTAVNALATAVTIDSTKSATVVGSVTAGSAYINTWPVSASYAVFQNSSLANTNGNQALIQMTDGHTELNAVASKVVSLTQGSVVKAQISTGGNFNVASGGTIGLGSETTPTTVLGVAGFSKVNNISTAGGIGFPVIYGSGRATAQVAANASVATYTNGAADGTFEVSANVLVTTATTHAFTVTCAYTDEGNTARTITLTFSQLSGTFLTSIANTGGAVPYEGVPLHIRVKASTSITIATTGTFTAVVYNVEGLIKQMS